MHHLRTRLITSLAAGALFTLASAWFPAAFVDVRTGRLHNLEREPPVAMPASIGAPTDWHIRTWHECWGPGLRYDLISECEWMGSTIGMSPSTAPNRTVLRMTAGFPVPCLRWTPWAGGDLPESKSRSPWHIGIDLPGKQLIGQRVERALPLRPVFWPTLINVSIYALASLLLMALAAAIRAAVRHRRGQCTRCAYPIGGLAACPECGNAAQG